MLCEGASTVLAVDLAGATCAWNTGSTAEAITVDDPGLYTVVVHLGGCMATDSVRVDVLPSPRPLHAPLLCEGGSVTVAWPSDTVSVTWWDGLTGPTRRFDTPGTYAYRLSYGASCTATETLTIAPGGSGVAFVPNAFTPDGDGHNDVFAVLGTLDEDTQLLIYDRWGELLMASTSATPAWDGNYHGAPVSPGVYVYHLSYSAPCGGGARARMAGSVSLIR
ncbi:MAG: gliding motility-associated C-terminal domain-containing protein [Bacteroidetes bacterium]|nr:gliding motility-associated C-terminal domain-containing protein [Bacteroidota bacterium]